QRFSRQLRGDLVGGIKNSRMGRRNLAQNGNNSSCFVQPVCRSIYFDQFQTYLKAHIWLFKLRYNRFEISTCQVCLAEASFTHAKQRADLHQPRLLFYCTAKMWFSSRIVVLKIEEYA